MENFSVYKHTLPNKKIYIGITSKKPIYRWNNGKGYKNQSLFYRAILKYGWDNIKHEILFTGLSEREACEKEIELIAKYKSNDRKFGYNISNGGGKTACGVNKYKGLILDGKFEVLSHKGNKLQIKCLCCGKVFERCYGSITSKTSKIKCACMRKFKPKNEIPKKVYHLITYKGVTHNATEWARILNTTRETIKYRELKGYDLLTGK